MYYLEDFKPSHSSPSIRQLVAVLSPRTPGFVPGTFQVKFVTGQIGTVATFFSEYRCFPIYHINITLIIRTSGRNVGTFKHNGALADNRGGFRMSG